MKYKYQLLMVGALMLLSSFSSPKSKSSLITGNLPIKSKPIIFIENAFSAALKEAKAKRKYLFVDAYATWCGPCRQLKNITFKNVQAAEFFNKNFVNAAIDMEKGEGKNLALTWDVQEYPTLLIVDYNGKVVLRSIGYLNAKELIDFGKKALKIAS